ncbi:MAG: hypothetical protein OXM54_12750 [Acidimicrobiaceae bacterium]|nr:hypothetical protein [Acidimicrobiaceae bacterium]
MVFPTLSSAQGAEFERVAAAALAGAEQVTVELAINPGGRAPSLTKAQALTRWLHAYLILPDVNQ